MRPVRMTIAFGVHLQRSDHARSPDNGVPRHGRRCRCHSLLFEGLCPVIPTAIPIRHSRNLLAGIHAAHRLDARLKTAGMTVAGFPLSELAGKAALSVYVGYADGIRPAAGSIFPYPWEGSPGVIFEGCTGSCDYDAGAVRLVNNSRGSSGDVGCGS